MPKTRYVESTLRGEVRCTDGTVVKFVKPRPKPEEGETAPKRSKYAAKKERS